MRKKTKSFLLGLMVGTLLMGSVSIGIYYYFGHYESAKIKNQYESLLDEYKHPPQIKVFRLVKNVSKNEEVGAEDVESVFLPAVFKNEFLQSADEGLIGLTAKVDLKEGTILYEAMLSNKSEVPNDLRIIELCNLITPLMLEKGHEVDVRISFPSGMDYVVLAKKELIEYRRVDTDSGVREVCIFHLNEDEQLRLSSALVDAYLRDGTFLYTTIYVAPDSQESAAITYPANDDVQNLIANDPNIVNRAIVALEKQKRAQLSESLSRLPSNIKREVPVSAFKQESDDESTDTGTTDLSDVN
ncbi:MULTISPECIES: SAF domain-containing protein [unclassified Fusibacter]|uniref:SAF domain-containing protein n=1 Tax=unclassified Fusibacter TaxID=2624464 RepID=UPI0010135A92|nr:MULTISPECIES: SAF domain-containing protein [unclassified Fusibacter]MCK8060829.1 hypothetical protein [Fusibacter sp. A2]NPE23125.1 hypothetical protein [Fusibacter sp. A1]RXV59797.1 hypothetical protein DWB64_14935 [Fusibacter sp. A1]